MNITKSIFCLAFFALSIVAYAQENKASQLGALVTDRPDQTESASITPKGYLQIETGVGYESFKENNKESINNTLNTTLVRYGVLDNLELRLGWDLVEGSTKVNGNKLNDITSGFSPLLLGAKIAISEENGVLPEIAFLGHLNLPFSASSNYKPETTGTNFRFSFAHTLSDKSSLAYNLGASWENDSSEAAYIYTLVYGYSISDKLGSFMELYGDFPENSKANHLWDAGFTYLISDNFQLDASAGTSITKGQDIGIGLGLCFRLPVTKQ